jgi:hypothetical protein
MYKPIWNSVEYIITVPVKWANPFHPDMGELVDARQMSYERMGPTPLELLFQITPTEAVVAVTVACVTGYFIYRAYSYLWIDK